jgi:hypothetical protein
MLKLKYPQTTRLGQEADREAALESIRITQMLISKNPWLSDLVPGFDKIKRMIEKDELKKCPSCKNHKPIYKFCNLRNEEQKKCNYCNTRAKRKSLVVINKLDANQILTCLCSHFNVSEPHITGPSLDRDVTIIRQIIMYMIFNFSDLGLRDTARMVGRRDHTTVIFSLNKIRDYKSAYKNFFYALKPIQKALRDQDFDYLLDPKNAIHKISID